MSLVEPEIFIKLKAAGNETYKSLKHPTGPEEPHLYHFKWYKWSSFLLFKCILDTAKINAKKPPKKTKREF